MTTQACARCHRDSDPDLLLPAESGGRICLECEEELQSLRKMRTSVWVTIASLPILAMLGYALLCIPYLGVFISFCVAIAAIVASIRAFRLGLNVQADPSEFGVSTTEPVLLMVSAGISGAIALGLLGLTLLGMLGLILSMFL